MKFYSHGLFGLRRKPASAFTLVEMMVAVAVFSLVVLCTVGMQVYAARVYTLAATKLSATEEARSAMNDLRDQVRSARLVYVGNYVYNTGNPPMDFTPIANGSL